MHRKHTTAEDGMQSARSVSHSGKTLRWYLSFRPVAVLAALFASFLTTGLVAGSFAGVAGAVVTGHAESHALATSGLGYTALPSPIRIADTRTGATDPSTYAGKTLATGTSLTVDIPASAGVPTNAGAIVVNITAINPASAGFLTVYPGGSTLPTTANVTFTAGQTVGNLVTVGLGPDATSLAAQSFTVYNGPATGGGAVDFTADISGYYAPQTAGSGASYVGLQPARIYDSRTGSGEPGAGTTLANGGSDNVTVTGLAGVPSTASAVVLNVAVTNTTSPSFISAYPAGSPPPATAPTASQNFVAGETISSQVVAGVGTNGQVTIANHAGGADVIVDVDGYFTQPGASGSVLTVLPAPVRLTDTRPTGVVGGASAIATVQGTGATAGVLSLADIATKGAGNFLTAYPTGSTAPLAANVNYTPSDTYNIVENAAYVATGSSSDVSVLNGPAGAATANVVVDEDAYFAPISAAPAYVVTTTSAANVTVPATVTYTATGLPTAAGTVAEIALFPSAGANAPIGNVFTPTTAGTAGPAAGEGTTVIDTANGSGVKGATIATVNGVVQTGTTPVTEVFGVTPETGGTLTFTVTSSVPDSTIPVVYTAPSGAGLTPPLLVTGAGAPQSGYASGPATAETWNAALAATGSYANFVVSLVNNTAGTFQACATAATTPTCFTFVDTNAGDTYQYQDPALTLGLSQAQFQSFLSGPSVQTNSLPTPVLGDEISVVYNPAGPSAFTFSTSAVAPTINSVTVAGSSAPGSDDVPAAPTALGATAGATGGVVLNWTAPPNLDVISASDTALYKIYRAVVTSGSIGSYALLTTITPTAGTPPATTFTDSSAVAGTTYSYVVAATAGALGGGLGGPASTAFTFTPTSASSAPLAPISVHSGFFVPGGATTLGSGSSVTFTFNSTVTLAATSFVLNLTDGTNEVQLNPTDSVATVASVNGGTNNAVTYALNSQPTTITGTDVVLSGNVEALSETGVSNTVGPWNIPGSGAFGDGTVTRDFGTAAVTPAPAGAPTVTTVTAASGQIAGTCNSGSTVNLYTINGVGVNTAVCAGGAFTITTVGAPQTTYLVTQTAAPLGSVESAATEVVGFTPNPIGTGATGTPATTVTLSANDIPGAPLFFFITGVAAGTVNATGSNGTVAVVSGTNLSAATATTVVTAPANGVVTVAFTPAAATAAGTTTLNADDAAAALAPYSAQDAYTY